MAVLLLTHVPLLATDYYVSKSAGGASNSNDGLSPTFTGGTNGPWLTITKCASTIAAGDSCNIIAGASGYDERVGSANSGTSANYIVYRGYPTGGTKPVVRGFALSNKSYIEITGLEITSSGLTNDGVASILVQGNSSISTGLKLINNYIHDTAGQAVRCAFNTLWCDGLIVRGNTMTLIGPAWDGMSGGRAPIVDVWCTNCLIESNDMSRGEDFIRIRGDYNVIRNNVFHDSDERETAKGASHIDVFQGYCATGGPTPKSFNYLLVEGNIYHNDTYAEVPAAQLHTHFGLQNDTTDCGGSTTVIVRYNIARNLGSYFYTTSASARQLNSSDNHKIYNNTIYRAGIGENPRMKTYLVEQVDQGGAPFVRDGAMINNILVDAGTPRNQRGYNFDGTTGSVGKNNLGYFTDGSTRWSEPMNTERRAILNQNPQFAETNTFALAPGSPARDAGAALTTVHENDTGSGTSLILADAHFFQAGWATANADHIAVGSPGNIATIRAIDYATNTVTLASSISRKDGDSVWLYKRSDGAIVLIGSAPDVGAFESR